MGVRVRELECEEVVFTLPDRKIVVKEPRVLVIEAQGERVYQVLGKEVEVERETAEAVEVTEEDVRFVAEQAGVSLEEARKALEETGGDLALAIVLLQERRKG